MTLKCPSCKKEMTHHKLDALLVQDRYFLCHNESCRFYGIKRLDTQFYKEDLKVIHK